MSAKLIQTVFLLLTTSLVSCIGLVEEGNVLLTSDERLKQSAFLESIEAVEPGKFRKFGTKGTGSYRAIKFISDETFSLETNVVHQFKMGASVMMISDWLDHDVKNAFVKLNETLKQCDIGVSSVRLQALDSTQHYREWDMKRIEELTSIYSGTEYDAKEIMVIFVGHSLSNKSSTKQQQGSSITENLVVKFKKPNYMKNKIFLSEKAMAENTTFPHELTHVLCNHKYCNSNAPDFVECDKTRHNYSNSTNYMYHAATQTNISSAQCKELVHCGITNGFFD